MNKIHELRVQTGLSRKEFSIELGIPYMTLTDWELSKHEAPDYVYRLMEYYVKMKKDTYNPFDKNTENNVDLCSIWEDQKNYRNTFPEVVEHNIVPVKHIYPLKQRTAVELHNALKDDMRISNIILFGSSVSLRCTKDSDIDLSVRLKDEYTDIATKNSVSEIIQDICDWTADIIWFDRLKKKSKLYNNILKGVQIV